MVSLVRAILSGIAATDSLPMSGAAHLLWLLGWMVLPILFDMLVCLGAAALVYFWRDWLTVLRAGLNAVCTCSIQDLDARLLYPIFLGTIPAALAGLLHKSSFESIFYNLPVVTALLFLPTVGYLRDDPHRRKSWKRDLSLHGLRVEKLRAQNLRVQNLRVHAARATGLAQVGLLLPDLFRSVSRGAATGLKGCIGGFLRPMQRRIGFAGNHTGLGTSCLLVALLF